MTNSDVYETVEERQPGQRRRWQDAAGLSVLFVTVATFVGGVVGSADGMRISLAVGFFMAALRWAESGKLWVAAPLTITATLAVWQSVDPEGWSERVALVIFLLPFQAAVIHAWHTGQAVLPDCPDVAPTQDNPEADDDCDFDWD